LATYSPQAGRLPSWKQPIYLVAESLSAANPRAIDRQWDLDPNYNQMVVDGSTDEALDELLHALADTTRRDILRRCGGSPASVSRLAEAYPMSFAAVQKHVAVLERAGLVTKERHGREQLVRTDPAAVGRARQAIDQLEAAWRDRVDRMADLLTPAPLAAEEHATKGREE
jgi:DNA-binding transcriptional ArsR family regulator